MNPMKPINAILAFSLVCLLSAGAGASPAPAAFAQPCCAIVSIDRVSGVVTAKYLKSGRTFTFGVDSRSLTQTLRVGQKVWVNAKTRQAGFTDAEPCCDIKGNVKLEYEPING